MKEINTIIIGAGVSGLTYAGNTSEDYLIIEKDSKAGGLCKTFYQDGFVWDYAGHFFHFANKDVKRSFEEHISDDDLFRCKKKTNINYNGAIIDYPFQMNIHQLQKDEFIDCLYDLFHRSEKKSYESFEDMLYAKFGKSITEKFLKPYNEKLYACDLNELDPDAMGRFFPYANPQQIIDNMKNDSAVTYNSYFDYPKRGAQFFIDILLSQINKNKLLLCSEVQSIDRENNVAVINGEKYKYKKIVNTIPLNQFIRLLNDFNIDKYENYLTCNKVLVFNLGFDKPAVDKTVHWTYIPMKDVNFYRVGYYSNILGTDRLSMYIEIGFKQNDEIDINEQLKLTLEGLKKLGIVTDHKLLSYNHVIIDPGYVHITSKSILTVKNILQELEQYNIYSLGRYGKWTYCSIEDCIIDAISLARNV